MTDLPNIDTSQKRQKHCLHDECRDNSLLINRLFSGVKKNEKVQHLRISQ